MRIIKAAKRIQEFELVCTKCSSVLGITPADVAPEYGDFTITCPVCGHLNKRAYTADLFPWIMEEEENDRKIQSDNSMRINTL